MAEPGAVFLRRRPGHAADPGGSGAPQMAEKRGGERPLPLAEGFDVPVGTDAEVLAVDDALGALESVDPDLARLVNLRFFAGHDGRRVRGSARRFAGDHPPRVGLRQGLVAARAGASLNAMDAERWKAAKRLLPGGARTDARTSARPSSISLCRGRGAPRRGCRPARRPCRGGRPIREPATCKPGRAS